MPKILIVAAHPDDEVLGCGGTILKHNKDNNFYCLILGEGEMGREDSTLDRLHELKGQAFEVANKLGLKDLHLGSAPDNKFDSKPLLYYVHYIEKYVKEIGEPDYVFTHYYLDLNIDHQITSKAVQTVFRTQPGHMCQGLFFFEILSSTEYNYCGPWFKPTFYVNIEETLGEKIEIFKSYENEIREWPHPRSMAGILHQARNRGREIGFSAAEAFMVGYLKK